MGDRNKAFAAYWNGTRIKHDEAMVKGNYF